MRNWKQRTLALMMSAVLLCGSVVGVGAVEEEYYNRIKADSVVVNEGYTLKLLNSAGAEVAAVADTVDEQTMQVHKNVVKLELTIMAPKAGQEYVSLLLSGGEEIPTNRNIRYIDQGDVATFTIYPDQISQPGEYNVVVSSVDGKVTVATFEVLEPPYRLGDVDEDDQISAADANQVLRAVAKLQSLTNKQAMAADADGDSAISAADANKILRVVAKLETM